MNFECKYPKQKFFAIIKDIDIRLLLKEEFEDLKKIVESFGVTVIQNQNINDSNQIEFSKKFGKLEHALEHDTLEGIEPEITRISNVGIDNKILPINDEKVVYDRGNRFWHSDSSYKRIPAKFSILSAREIPKNGGGTEFIDSCYALETWGKKPRQYSLEQIKEVVCAHSIVYSRMVNTGDIFDDKYKKKMPSVKQRLIRTHSHTKRSAFYAGSHCSHIIGWKLDTGRKLIKEINEWITKAGPIARHKWNTGDIVIWDNRRVLHRGTPFDESSARRIMHRTTVAGDKPSIEESVEIN